MSNSKRSWEAMLESDDEDEPSMGRRTLPVARLPETFNGEPMDGMQYLFMVRRDARKLPFVTRVEDPFKQLSVETVAKQEVSSLSRPRVPLPSEEWRSMFIKRFRNFRKNSIQPTIGVAAPFSSTGHSKRMPEKKERDRWWDFINGRPECEWNPPKKPKKSNRDRYEVTRQRLSVDHINRDDVAQYEVPITEEVTEDVSVAEALVVTEFGEMEDLVERDGNGDMENVAVGVEEGARFLPTPLSTPQPESRYKSSEHGLERRMSGPRHPTPTLLMLMDSRYCMHLLMYFTHWITRHLEHLESGQPSSPFSHLSHNHARWMFALLSRVDEQLTSDELSTLRDLARACISFVKDLNKNIALDSSHMVMEGSSGVRWVGDPADAPMDERACWMVVAILSDFWGQKDLWMDAESTINGS